MGKLTLDTSIDPRLIDSMKSYIAASPGKLTCHQIKMARSPTIVERLASTAHTTVALVAALITLILLYWRLERFPRGAAVLYFKCSDFGVNSSTTLACPASLSRGEQTRGGYRLWLVMAIPTANCTWRELFLILARFSLLWGLNYHTGCSVSHTRSVQRSWTQCTSHAERRIHLT